MNCLQQIWILRGGILLFFLIQEVSCPLPAPQNVSIFSLNLEHKLMWKPGPGTPALTRFRVQSYNMKRVRWISVQNCSDLAADEFCDLTKPFKDIFGNYLARVQAFSLEEKSNWTSSKLFHPLSDTTLSPPDVSLRGCGNCLLMNLSAPVIFVQHHELFKNFYQVYSINVSRTRDKAQFGMSALNGETVINYLEPGVEYCIIAITVSSFQNKALPSGPHCAYTSPKVYNTVAILTCALCTFFLVILFSAAVIYNIFEKSLQTPTPCFGGSPCLEENFPVLDRAQIYCWIW